jgi:PAS domain S-box-containing protein/putative nucleotidyltransferase with HDIG domain
MTEQFITPIESELRYRRLFESAQDGILILNYESGVITDANPFITHLLGFAKEELIGKELWEIGAIVDKTAALKAFGILQNQGYVRYEDLPLKTKDGRMVNVEFVSNAYDVGPTKVIQCNIRDITDRRILEHTLEGSSKQTTRSELRYRRLFESAQDGILILDYATGLIQDANPFIINLLGYKKEELVGRELWEIGPMIDKAAALTAFTTLKDKGYIRYDDLPLKNKSGEIINVEFVSNAYGVNGDRVMQCNIRDISERKKAEKDLLQYQHSVSISMREMVETLANVIVARDPYTGGHQKRVANLATTIATELGLPMHSVEGIRMAAMVHDIGKITIPAEILTKPTQLTTYELAMLRNHVQSGYEMLKHVHFPWPIAQTVLQHHERLDGSGYPNGIKGDLISEEARIIAVADTVEAMSSDRPYRKGKGITAALEEITMGSESLFDPIVVAACVKVFREDGYVFPDLI